jgi:hypothetical protein
VKGGLL